MAVPEVSVKVSMLLQPFILKDVSIGLNGERPDFHSWLEEMDTSAPYSEEAFEWKIAQLLPCPRSFFTLGYESRDGNLRIIFGARPASLEAFSSPAEGYCEVCYARMTDEYEREHFEYVNGCKYFCMMCYDTKAYEHFFEFDQNVDKLEHLSPYERKYLARLNQLYDEFFEIAVDLKARHRGV